MGVACGGLDLRVPKQLSDHRQALAEGQSARGEGVSKIVKVNFLDARLAPGAIPEGEVSAAGPGGVSRGPQHLLDRGDPVGIQVGTAIATLVRKAEHTRAEQIEFWHLWGQSKPADLIETAEAEPEALYEDVEPILPLGLPFVRTAVSADWFDWPALPDLFPVSFPGVKTSRDGFLVDVDLRRFQARITDYFDAGLSHEEIAARYPSVMKTTARFDASAVRDSLLKCGGPEETGFARFAYLRPLRRSWKR